MRRICTTCGVEKPLEEFHRNNTRENGRAAVCKVCRCEVVRGYMETRREQYRERAQKWREENRERHRAYTRQWAAVHQEQKRETDKVHTARRRARLRDVFDEDVDPELVYERDEWTCGICGESVSGRADASLDHVIPLSKGGRHAYNNVQLAHRSCNFRKGTQTPVS